MAISPHLQQALLDIRVGDAVVIQQAAHTCHIAVGNLGLQQAAAATQARQLNQQGYNRVKLADHECCDVNACGHKVGHKAWPSLGSARHCS
jgi:hypothetical protein